MLNSVVFVINPRSGINRNPDRIIQWIDEYWENSGIQYEILRTAHRGHGVELAREAAARGADIVVAAGGDGTINEIGQALVGTRTALGVIPAGSGNGFARNVNIPLNQKAAIALLRNPIIKAIDVGKINQHYFFNVAGAGLDAVISAKFDHLTTRGLIPYFVLGVREYFRFHPEPVVIHLEGKEIRRNPVLLSIANLPEFGGNATIAPNARPDDGLLDVCILNPVQIGRALLNLPKLFNGRIEQLPEMEIYQVKKVQITRMNGGPIHTDGDPHEENATLSVEVLPGQLKLAVANSV